ncbi:MAG: TonB-dependent receptor [Bacteroidetes bacterium]|nr:MAG: TonB-dependent receptor [Bacteroidota bacterium]
MKKMTLHALLALGVSISAFVPALAQSGKEKGRISGTVSDENKKTIESASVSLLHAKDSSVVRQMAAGQGGRFEFENIKDGAYLVSVSAIGHPTYYSAAFEISSKYSNVVIQTIQLATKSAELKEVAVTGRKSFIEQKPDRMVVNVDAAPTNAGSTVMDVLEKSPGVTIDKDGNISLKGKQGVLIMIDNKPTYLNATQLANYLKSLPASAIEQLEIMTNPSAKYDASGNSGIINIKTKKNKAKGFNGSVTTTYTQGVYPKPGASANLNYRNGKFNVFFNGGYSHWEGFQELDINRNYLNASDHKINSIFTQHSSMKFTNPELNAKLGMDYYLSSKTTIGFVASGFSNNETDESTSTIYLKNPSHSVDSIVYSPSINKTKWRNGSFNLNFRHQFDSSGTELTADADYVRYTSGSDQFFHNITYDPNWNKINETILTGDLPSQIDIYSLKSDFTHFFNHALKVEAGFKTSYVSTDNQANYFNVINGEPIVDTTKTNHFLYRENVNAVYVNMSRQVKKWNFQVGLRMENTNYSGHQLGNEYTVNNNDSLFSRSYFNLFPTAYVSYQLNEKNQFSVNYGRRIDRPAYQDLNPFLFFLDQYTYQAGNPYLQPQYTDNIELSHTYKGWLTTTLNYSNTKNFFTETFEQDGHATIVRNGNIGQRQNAGAAVSAQIPVKKWWTAIVYANVNYNKFEGMLYGENIHISATTFLINLNNQFHFAKGWSGELSGFYRTKGVEGQILIEPFGQASAAISKQLMKDKANLKLGFRDMFYTEKVKGQINFQQTEATFRNVRDSRQVSLSFTYRFGKPIKGSQPNRHSGGAGDESKRVKSGGNN